MRSASRPPHRWRSEALARAVAEIETGIDRVWRGLLDERAVQPGSPQEAELAWLVADEPAEHEWRVVDAALDRLWCRDCGLGLTTGPVTCRTCTHYHGTRFVARELDRPYVPAGNDHALRVVWVVTQARMRYSAHARVGYELILPDLLAGTVPTSAQAQAARALINKLTDEECDQVTNMAEVETRVRGR